MSSFIQFPPRAEIALRLAAVGPPTAGCEGFRRTVAQRLDAKVFDAAAFTFVLTELIYDAALDLGEERPILLADAILALTQDRELAISALQTFDEIEGLIEA